MSITKSNSEGTHKIERLPICPFFFLIEEEEYSVARRNEKKIPLNTAYGTVYPTNQFTTLSKVLFPPSLRKRKGQENGNLNKQSSDSCF